jgi:hypothetical protein
LLARFARLLGLGDRPSARSRVHPVGDPALDPLKDGEEERLLVVEVVVERSGACRSYREYVA